MPKEIAVPFRLDSTGRVAVQEDPDRQINAHAMGLAATTNGERVMMTPYGCSLIELVFENNTQEVSGEIVDRVATGLGKWEPGIKLRGVRPTYNDQGLAKVELDIATVDSPGTHAGDSYVNTATVHVGGRVTEVIRG
ncbi:GPW/gp25 family protein [Actinomadura atramentaria]|uniref:GPW/gp25 family protein n=1 Tax=Actinomadura atramentaria TaxID=1990 RepID=UPI00036AEC82|nr:GPW/gp25 family protein [Actinomadura atramentaria]